LKRRVNNMRMKKVVVHLEERLTYTDEITVEVPEAMTEAQIDAYVETAVSDANSMEGGAKTVAWILEGRYKLGVEHASSFPESPRSSEVEFVDLRRPIYEPKKKDQT
jgi:hypothetical protein